MTEPKLSLWQRAQLETVIEAMNENMDVYAGRYLWMLETLQKQGVDVSGWREEIS